ncbi:hypothetical protein B0H15DRAFT_836909 [Mycena belliarum]|uniref:Zn(2)-C6 fungal-type domain-containing protein n=1 Tax=Mycena belliarum TaxID=1033014 RepID=A0AAD6U5H0_9AGAR|nr:hypothetical protein B0H15DRAFT_836909 [Mycena belliae]
MCPALNPAFSNLTHQENADLNRKAGKAPCAECKRLKLKCDKKIPCASCVRRGCEETCPTGTYLPTGRGKRHYLLCFQVNRPRLTLDRTMPTEAARLRRTVAEMEVRIKELETAVTGTCNYHLDYCPHLGISSPEASSVNQLVERVGALSITDSGDSQYFGPTAGTEALLSIESSDPVLEQTPSAFVAATAAFSFGLNGTMQWKDDHALTQLFVRLPSKPRAWQLCEVYFENGCWSGTPIMRAEFVELLSRVYGGLGTPDPSACSLHEMAVLYGVFALGALVDLTLAPYNAECEYYFDLCQAALSVHSIFDSPSPATIQALVLVSIFHSDGGPRFSMNGAWSIICLASSLCQNMGLHIGRPRPGSTPQETQRLRALFWETYSIETLRSLAVGRPTGTSLANISCPFPTDEQQICDTGSIRGGYYRRRWQFIKEIAAPVVEMYLTVHPPAYSVIVDFDQRIRKFMHATECTDLSTPDDLDSPSVYIQRNMIHHSCTNMLLYIHNDAFIDSISENPVDPFYTSKATSYLSAHRYASEVLRAAIQNSTRHAELFTRWWPFWKPLFNAAIVLGVVAAKCPTIQAAPQALLEHFVAVDLFERGAAMSARARSALTVLRTLREKAITAYSQHAGDPEEGEGESASDAALAVFAGHTRVVATNILTRARCQNHPQIYPGPPALEDYLRNTPAGSLDPVLLHYLANPPVCPETVRPAGAVEMMERQDTLGDVEFAAINSSSFLDVPLAGSSGEEEVPCLLPDPQWAEFLENL